MALLYLCWLALRFKDTEIKLHIKGGKNNSLFYLCFPTSHDINNFCELLECDILLILLFVDDRISYLENSKVSCIFLNHFSWGQTPTQRAKHVSCVQLEGLSCGYFWGTWCGRECCWPASSHELSYISRLPPNQMWPCGYVRQVGCEQKGCVFFLRGRIYELTCPLILTSYCCELRGHMSKVEKGSKPYQTVFTKDALIAEISG